MKLEYLTNLNLQLYYYHKIFQTTHSMWQRIQPVSATLVYFLSYIFYCPSFFHFSFHLISLDFIFGQWYLESMISVSYCYIYFVLRTALGFVLFLSSWVLFLICTNHVFFLLFHLHSVVPNDELLYPVRQWRKHGSHLRSIALKIIFL